MSKDNVREFNKNKKEVKKEKSFHLVMNEQECIALQQLLDIATKAEGLKVLQAVLQLLSKVEER